MSNEQVLRIEKRADDTAIIWFDVPGESVNTLKSGFEQEFDRVLTALDQDEALAAVVLASAKESFIAGADINMLQGVETAAEAARLAQTGQAAMASLESFRLPIVAAIDGVCYGGGLEVALACSGRIASNSASTKFGQLEVNLGLIPGAGGTQRLPRLVGAEAALEMILTGKKVTAGEARDLGLVDDVVHPAILIETAVAHARRLAEGKKSGQKGRGLDWKALLLEDNPVGRSLMFKQAREKTLAKTHGNMPAPLKAIDVIRTGIEEGMEAGLAAEAAAFGKLVVSPEARQLMHLFFAREALKKETGINEQAQPREVNKVAVLGAGLMGSGIAYETVSRASRPVRLKDIDHAALRDGLRNIYSNLTERVRKQRMDERERANKMALVRPTTDYSGFGRVDVVIEAVFEDLELKHTVLREVEAHTQEEAIFATNTSALPIHEIAAASERPQQVIGMHYFSPVPKVPLLEVIVSDQTAPWVTATCVELGKAQGKTVIVVNDGTGFYTSRILGPYMNEAAYLLAAGTPIEKIDKSLVQFGFPVGPLKLLDEVGIDVAAKIAHILHEAFGERMLPPAALDTIIEDERQGRKNGRGFYRYQKKNGEYKRKNNGRSVDKSIYKLLDVTPATDLSGEEIADRCLLQMVNEAVYCYSDGIIRSARDGDVGAVFGLGFPPFLGGPFRYVDGQGAGAVVERLERYQQRAGDRFRPAPLLKQMAQEDVGFYDEQAPQPGSGTGS
jgi:3-hydroxyacyl-CoA dehydrogenase / enoyl-CoA hydratase / 3-hydroxybutyryl-CoA epimerase